MYEITDVIRSRLPGLSDPEADLDRIVREHDTRANLLRVPVQHSVFATMQHFLHIVQMYGQQGFEFHVADDGSVMSSFNVGQDNLEITIEPGNIVTLCVDRQSGDEDWYEDISINEAIRIVIDLEREEWMSSAYFDGDISAMRIRGSRVRPLSHRRVTGEFPYSPVLVQSMPANQFVSISSGTTQSWQMTDQSSGDSTHQNYQTATA